MPKENLYVASKVREHLKSRACRLSEDATGTPINDIIRGSLDDACRRAKANDRKTVMKRDL